LMNIFLFHTPNTLILTLTFTHIRSLTLCVCVFSLQLSVQ
jgi:hypothetical protein